MFPSSKRMQWNGSLRVTLTLAETFKLMPSSNSSWSLSIATDPEVMHWSISQFLERLISKEIDCRVKRDAFTIFDYELIPLNPIRVWLFVDPQWRFSDQIEHSSHRVVHQMTSITDSSCTDLDLMIWKKRESCPFLQEKSDKQQRQECENDQAAFESSELTHKYNKRKTNEEFNTLTNSDAIWLPEQWAVNAFKESSLCWWFGMKSSEKFLLSYLSTSVIEEEDWANSWMYHVVHVQWSAATFYYCCWSRVVLCNCLTSPYSIEEWPDEEHDRVVRGNSDATIHRYDRSMRWDLYLTLRFHNVGQKISEEIERAISDRPKWKHWYFYHWYQYKVWSMEEWSAELDWRNKHLDTSNIRREFEWW